MGIWAKRTYRLEMKGTTWQRGSHSTWKSTVLGEQRNQDPREEVSCEMGAQLSPAERRGARAGGSRELRDRHRDNSLPLLGSMRLPIDFQLVFFLFCVVWVVSDPCNQWYTFTLPLTLMLKPRSEDGLMSVTKAKNQEPESGKRRRSVIVKLL